MVTSTPSIPEPKHSVTFLTQATISYYIHARFTVLPAVDFNNQTPFAADEVADVADQRLLPYELMSVDLSVTDTIPKNCLRVCLNDAQPSRDSDGLPIWSAHCLAPHPDRFAIRPLPAKSGERLR